MLQGLARGSRRGARGLVAGLVAMTLLLPGVSPALAAGTLDQQQTAAFLTFVLGTGVSPAQTFTAGLTGALDQVNLPLAQFPPRDGYVHD